RIRPIKAAINDHLGRPLHRTDNYEDRLDKDSNTIAGYFGDETEPPGCDEQLAFPDQSQVRRLRHIDFAIMTDARPIIYVHDLIASLRSDLPIRLVVGTPNYGYLEQYRNTGCREIIQVPAREWKDFKDRPVHQRACWNYWRSLVFGVRNPFST